MDRERIVSDLHDHIAFDVLLRKQPLDRGEDLFDAGFDSLSLSRVLVFVEERYGVSIPDQEVVIDELSTLDKMAGFVSEYISKAKKR